MKKKIEDRYFPLLPLGPHRLQRERRPHRQHLHERRHQLDWFFIVHFDPLINQNRKNR